MPSVVTRDLPPAADVNGTLMARRPCPIDMDPREVSDPGPRLLGQARRAHPRGAHRVHPRRCSALVTASPDWTIWVTASVIKIHLELFQVQSLADRVRSRPLTAGRDPRELHDEDRQTQRDGLAKISAAFRNDVTSGRWTRAAGSRSALSPSPRAPAPPCEGAIKLLELDDPEEPTVAYLASRGGSRIFHRPAQVGSSPEPQAADSRSPYRSRTTSSEAPEENHYVARHGVDVAVRRPAPRIP